MRGCREFGYKIDDDDLEAHFHAIDATGNRDGFLTDKELLVGLSLMYHVRVPAIASLIADVSNAVPFTVSIALPLYAGIAISMFVVHDVVCTGNAS